MTDTVEERTLGKDSRKQIESLLQRAGIDRERGEYQTSASHVERAIRLANSDPGFDDSRLLARALRARSEIYDKLGDAAGYLTATEEWLTFLRGELRLGTERMEALIDVSRRLVERNLDSFVGPVVLEARDMAAELESTGQGSDLTKAALANYDAFDRGLRREVSDEPSTEEFARIDQLRSDSQTGDLNALRDLGMHLVLFRESAEEGIRVFHQLLEVLLANRDSIESIVFWFDGLSGCYDQDFERFSPVVESFLTLWSDEVHPLIESTDDRESGTYHLISAALLSSIRIWDAALFHACSACDRFEDERHKTASSAIRGAVTEDQKLARLVALRIAQQTNEKTLFLELLSQANLTAAVVETSTSATPDSLGGLREFAIARVGARLDVRVGNEGPKLPSVIGRRATSATLDILDLRSCHPSSEVPWLLLTWLHNGEAAGALIDEKSAVHTWCFEYNDNSDLRRLDEMGGFLLEHAENVTEALIVPQSASLGTEVEAHRTLAKYFLPEYLVSEIVSRISFGRPPLPLVVVTGALTESVCFSALVVGDNLATDFRLVEGCSAAYAPPLWLVGDLLAAKRTTPLPTTGSGRRLLACVDPKGDLAFARSAPDNATNLLGNPEWIRDEVGWGLPATVSNVADLLQLLAESPGSVFYFSGHGVSDPHDSMANGLALYDGVLTARDIFNEIRQVPSTIVLSACGSAGSQSSTSGEWGGLVTAMLARGATSVIATSWPIFDAPFTMEFDRRLVARLVGGEVASSALRNSQIEALESWRASHHHFGRGDGPVRGSDEAYPVTWASFGLYGVYGPNQSSY